MWHLPLPRTSPCPGEHLAYQSNLSGRWQIYVESLSEHRERVQVSTREGRLARWNPQGGELFYIDGNSLMAVEITTEPELRASPPIELFTGDQVGTNLRPLFNNFGRHYDVAPDGERFIVVQGVERGRNEVVVVQNWFEELKRLVPTD